MNELIKNFIYTSITIIIIFIIVVIISIIYCCNHPCTKSPVKERIDVDSITAINDSIKIKINNLDSIKNAKVIEVISLDNDSTIKLFYKLVSE